MTTPRLSVIVPAYNSAPYIEEAVRSVLAQTMPDLEVVVVDDGSPDESAAVVSAIDDQRVRLVRKANGGLASARNAGISAARGEVLGFLDGDDRWRPDKAQSHLEVLDTECGVGLTFSHSAYIDQGRARSWARPVLLDRADEVCVDSLFEITSATAARLSCALHASARPDSSGMSR